MKNTKHLDHFQSRRNFLCNSACASLGVTSLVNTLAHLRLMQSAVAQTAPPDYKAIICLFLYGGNDANNLLLPGAGAARTNYDLARPTTHPLHIATSGGTNNMLPLAALNSGTNINQANAGNSFGLHQNLTGMQSIFDAGDLAFISNGGTLVQPISRTEYIASSKPVPPQLFSHSDQQVQWQSSIPDRPFQSGWGGRIAELLNASYNPSSNVSMNISLGGVNSFQVGSSIVQYGVGTGGTVSLAGYNDATGPYGAALNTDGTYKTSDQGKTLQGFQQIMNLVHEHLLEDGYNEVMRRARANEAFIGTAIGSAVDATIADVFDNYYPTLNDETDIAKQLKMVARLMKGGPALGNNRQIFFVSMGGFDTHQDQPTGHATLMGQLDKALSAFRDTMKHANVNLWDDMVLFSHSDFARTLQPNGSEANCGTDHGWGGHQFTMGGPVIGKTIYGTFPDLERNNGIDVDSNRGRWIPSTSVEQYASVVAKWFGVSNADISTIFPNLGRFQSTSAIPTNLQFVDFSV